VVVVRTHQLIPHPLHAAAKVPHPRQVRGGQAVDGSATLPQLIDGWVKSGFISPEQGSLLKGSVASQPSGVFSLPEHRGSLVIEAVGYLGGAILLAGCILVASQLWDDLSTSTRVTVVGLASLLLVSVGFLVPAGTIGGRLRAVLWAAGTGAFAGFLDLLTDEALDLGGPDVRLYTSLGTAALAAGLFAVRRTVVQQLVLMVATAVFAAAVVDRLPAPTEATGLGVFAVGLVWASLAWGGLLSPQSFGLALGAAMTIFGAMLTGEADSGMVLTLLTIVAVLVWAVVVRDLALLVVAAVGALINAPPAIGRWFPDSTAAGFGVVAAGALLVLVAVGIARRSPRPTGAVPAWTVGTPRRGILAAALVVVAVTAVVLVLG
jgi:hypothetical protein